VSAWITGRHRDTFRVRSPGSEYLVNRERSVAFAADAELRCVFRPESRGPASSLLLNPPVNQVTLAGIDNSFSDAMPQTLIRDPEELLTPPS
jgi:hypothetical protein